MRLHFTNAICSSWSLNLGTKERINFLTFHSCINWRYSISCLICKIYNAFLNLERTKLTNKSSAVILSSFQNPSLPPAPSGRFLLVNQFDSIHSFLRIIPSKTGNSIFPVGCEEKNTYWLVNLLIFYTNPVRDDNSAVSSGSGTIYIYIYIYIIPYL